MSLARRFLDALTHTGPGYNPELDRLRAELAEVRADANAKIREAAQLAHDARRERDEARAELVARPTRGEVLREYAVPVAEGTANAAELRHQEHEATIAWHIVGRLHQAADAAERGESR